MGANRLGVVARAAALATLASVVAGAAHAADTPTKPLDTKLPGTTVYEAATADGLAYRWRGPRRYDAKAGVDLTLILHGTGLDRTWGFSNHAKDSFRPDDLVISPDGTTPNGKTFLFLGERKDAKRLHALIEEVKKVFAVRSTFLYGHSQGSFFAVWYAGEHPEDVDGVVAHASGIWGNTRLGAHGHHQAIVLMHGTQDPVVPYVQSPECLPALEDAGYPMARVRSLEGWNHWPAEHNGPVPHASQQLAWVTGMTTKDPARITAALDVLCDVKDAGEHDWAGAWSLGKRVLESPNATDAAKARARKAVEVVEALDRKHAAALASAKPGAPLDATGWAAHLSIYLRQMGELPAAKELATRWRAELDEHRKKANDQFERYWAAAQKKPQDVAAAFDAGVSMIESGFLHARSQDRALRDALSAWRKEAAKDPKRSKLSKKALSRAAVIDTMAQAWTKGWDAYVEVNKTAGDM
jgi:predicted esterase